MKVVLGFRWTYVLHSLIFIHFKVEIGAEYCFKLNGKYCGSFKTNIGQFVQGGTGRGGGETRKMSFADLGSSH